MFVRSPGPRPLAVGFSSVLAITLVPVLMVMFIKEGCARIAESGFPMDTSLISAGSSPLPEVPKDNAARESAVSRGHVSLGLEDRQSIHASALRRIGAYMPTALPGISITQASQLLQSQDRVLQSFPEVETVFGFVGRSDSATDNAPLDMYDTTIMLKPREQWPVGMTYEKLIGEMDEKLQYQG